MQGNAYVFRPFPQSTLDCNSASCLMTHPRMPPGGSANLTTDYVTAASHPLQALQNAWITFANIDPDRCHKEIICAMINTGTKHMKDPDN